MAAECRGAASLDISDCLELLRGQWVVVAVLLAVKTKDISDFKAVSHRCCGLTQSLMSVHGSDGTRVYFNVGRIERARGPCYEVATDMCISACGSYGAMAEQCLDHSGVNVCFQQVSGKAVAQGMQGDVLGDPRLSHGFLEDCVDRCGSYGLVRA